MKYGSEIGWDIPRIFLLTRMGYIRISDDLLLTAFHGTMSVLCKAGFIPVRWEMADGRTYKVYGHCPLFDNLLPGERLPEYDVVIQYDPTLDTTSVKIFKRVYPKEPESRGGFPSPGCYVRPEDLVTHKEHEDDKPVGTEGQAG